MAQSENAFHMMAWKHKIAVFYSAIEGIVFEMIFD